MEKDYLIFRISVIKENLLQLLKRFTHKIMEEPLCSIEKVIDNEIGFIEDLIEIHGNQNTTFLCKFNLIFHLVSYV